MNIQIPERRINMFKFILAISSMLNLMFGAPAGMTSQPGDLPHTQTVWSEEAQLRLHDDESSPSQEQVQDQTQDQVQEPLQDQTCGLNCDPIQDMTQEQVLEQSCDQNCDQTQDQVQEQVQDRLQEQTQEYLQDQTCDPIQEQAQEQDGSGNLTQGGLGNGNKP